MGKVTVNINNRTFQIACEDGEEARLKELAAFFSRHVDQLQGRFGHIGDARIYIMAGLLVADKLSDALSQIEEIQNEVKLLQSNNDRYKVDSRKLEELLLSDIELLTSKLEAISKSLSA
tara:strand:- start:3521 stop:3877 length:357 start_codon:yes stop_codon:yes gene_type:complete